MTIEEPPSFDEQASRCQPPAGSAGDVEHEVANREVLAAELPEWFAKAQARPTRRTTLRAAAASATLRGACGATPAPRAAGSPTNTQPPPAGYQGWSPALQQAFRSMVLLATSAARTEQLTVATGLAAAMVPPALNLAPAQYRRLLPHLPLLVGGMVGVTRLLHPKRASREYIEQLPHALVHTVTRLAQMDVTNRSLTDRLVAEVLAQQVAAVLPERPVQVAGRAFRPAGTMDGPGR